MKLRKLVRLCIHDRIKPHPIDKVIPGKPVVAFEACPGGVILPEDALVLTPEELEQRELDAYARGVNWRVFETDEPIAVEHDGVAGWWIPPFDVLSIRKTE